MNIFDREMRLKTNSYFPPLFGGYVILIYPISLLSSKYKDFIFKFAAFHGRSVDFHCWFPFIGLLEDIDPNHSSISMIICMSSKQEYLIGSRRHD